MQARISPRMEALEAVTIVSSALSEETPPSLLTQV